MAMYIDLLVIIVGLIIVLLFFKRFSSFVFFIAIVEIFLRIITFVKTNIGLKDVSFILGKYFPENIFDIIDKYTYKMDMVNLILKWCFVGIMTIFLSYIIKIFWKKKKI